MINKFNKVRALWYRIKYQYIFRKAVFGGNIVVKCKLKIVGPGKVYIGANCRIEPDPWGDDYVTIFTHRRSARVTIGDNVTLRATRFGSHLEITIKNNSVVENASVYDSDFHNIDATRRDDDYNAGDRKVVIGKNSYIGVESLCSKGTIVGDSVVMLPGCVIGTKVVPDNSLIGGLPGRLVQQV